MTLMQKSKTGAFECQGCSKPLSPNAIFSFSGKTYCRDCYKDARNNLGPKPPTGPFKKQASLGDPITQFDVYKKLTKAQKWPDICKLNDLDLDAFGTKKELSALPGFLEPDEVVFALASGIMAQTVTSNTLDFGTNTWLVVLTNDRFLFLDCAMLTSSVDSQSIRHDHVQAVSASQGFMFGKLTIDLGSRLVVVDNCPKAAVRVIADIANKWLKKLSSSGGPASTKIVRSSETPCFDFLEKVTRLAELGALSEQELALARERIMASAEFKAEKERFLSNLPT